MAKEIDPADAWLKQLAREGQNAILIRWPKATNGTGTEDARLSAQDEMTVDQLKTAILRVAMGLEPQLAAFIQQLLDEGE